MSSHSTNRFCQMTATCSTKRKFSVRRMSSLSGKGDNAADNAAIRSALLTPAPAHKDFVFDENLKRCRRCCRYLDARKDASSKKRYMLFERALRNLPGSYKLWHAYLRERLEVTRGSQPSSPVFEALNNTFERALVTMHKMPRIWEMYLRFLLEQKLVTRTRRACDRALAALPVTQHERVWSIYLVRLPWPCPHVPTSLGS